MDLLVELVIPYLSPASSARPSGCGVVRDSGRDFRSQEGKWARSGLHSQLPLVWACLAMTVLCRSLYESLVGFQNSMIRDVDQAF